jgi:Zn-finger nucleic acid-binding protein
MMWVRVGRADLLECGSCDGIWVEAPTFEQICADRESQAALLHPHEPRTEAGPAPAFRYRPCPLCAKLMNRVNFGRASGAVVDVCKGHGTFLDRGELHQIARFIQSGGMDRLRAAEREQLAEDRRRLQDVERMHVRMLPDSSTATLNDAPIRRLLSALFDRAF